MAQIRQRIRLWPQSPRYKMDISAALSMSDEVKTHNELQYIRETRSDSYTGNLEAPWSGRCARSAYGLSFNYMAQGETVHPQEFIDSYDPDTIIRFDNGLETTLAQAMEAESKYCTAETARRQDSSKRIGWIASRLHAAGSLRPEDEQYLPATE